MEIRPWSVAPWFLSGVFLHELGEILYYDYAVGGPSLATGISSKAAIFMIFLSWPWVFTRSISIAWVIILWVLIWWGDHSPFPENSNGIFPFSTRSNIGRVYLQSCWPKVEFTPRPKVEFTPGCLPGVHSLSYSQAFPTVMRARLSTLITGPWPFRAASWLCPAFNIFIWCVKKICCWNKHRIIIVASLTILSVCAAAPDLGPVVVG